MTRDELIEKMAEALFDAGAARVRTLGGKPHHESWTECRHVYSYAEDYRKEARAALSTLTAFIPGLDDAIAGKAVIVPVEATEEMTKAGVEFRLRTAISHEEPWPNNTAALFAAMISASPYKRGRSDDR
jgi:hypothetical protein